MAKTNCATAFRENKLVKNEKNSFPNHPECRENRPKRLFEPPTPPQKKTILGLNEKSQHGCVRWALCEHLLPPCHDFACGGLRNNT